MNHYKQTTRYTSAAAGLMMLIKHFKPDFELSRENEFDIWHESAALPVRGSSIYGLAISAFKRGVLPIIYVEEPDYKFPGYRFKSYTKNEVDIAAFSSEMLQRKAEELGISIHENDFEFGLIKKFLVEEKKLMVRLIVGVLRDSKLNRRNPHYVPIINYDVEKKIFEILDSQNGITEIPEEKMRESFEAVHDCKRDNRMIIFG